MIEVLLGLVIIGMLIVSGLLWWRIYNAQINQQRHVLSIRNTYIPPLGFVDIVSVFVIQMLFQTIGGTIVFVLTNTTRIDFENLRQMTYFNFIVGATSIVAAIVTVGWIWGRYQDRRAAGWVPETFTRDLKLGFIGFVLFVPPMLMLQAALTQFWEYEHPTMEMISIDSPLLSVVSAWLMASIVAPLNEEIIFRVVLLGWLLRCFAYPRDVLGWVIGGKPLQATIAADVNDSQTDSIAAVEAALIAESQDGTDADLKRDLASATTNPFASPKHNQTAGALFGSTDLHRKTWMPLILVALLFAAAHIGQGPAPIPIFFLGFALCLLYRQTGSLVPCVITHFLLNTFSMAVFTIEQFYGSPDEETLPELVETANKLFFYVSPFTN